MKDWQQTALKKVLGSALPMVNLIFNYFPSGIMIADQEGRVVYCNQAQFDIEGLSAEEVVGRFLPDVSSPVGANSSIILRCLNAEKPILNQWLVYYNQKYDHIYVTCHAFPLLFSGRLTGCISFCKSYPQTNSYYPHPAPSSEIQHAFGDNNFAHLIGCSQPVVHCLEIARAAASCDLPVLIHGETGVGKELLAKGIHQSGARREKPFVAVNCSAIPETLFESLVFGATKGTFTGAVERAGFFEEANNGTIYLDEIDSLPISLQPKLLRVLQEKEVFRLGSNRGIKLNVKVISSMARNPLELVRCGLFRADLFYRLGAILLPVPALRERLDDLDLLVNHFIAKYSTTMGLNIKRVSHDFMKLLQMYDWPGNIRELEHILSGAMALAKGRRQTLGVELLPKYFKKIIFNQTLPPSSKYYLGKTEKSSFPQEPTTQGTAIAVNEPAEELLFARRQTKLREEEKSLILSTLHKTFGNVTLAARLMGLAPQVLHYKIKKHGLNAKAIKTVLRKF
jgi:arginine utilization regulatory protein